VENYFSSELVCNATEVHPEVQTLRDDDDSIQVQTPWFYQYKLLATRNFLNVVRLPQTSYVKLTTTCVTATFVAFFFWQAGSKAFVNKDGAGPYPKPGCTQAQASTNPDCAYTIGQYYTGIF